jgi:hypothetical protein
VSPNNPLYPPWAPPPDPDPDLAAIRDRYRTAQMAGTHAVDAGRGWDESSVAAVTRSWQDVSTLHDEVKRARPVIREALNAAIEAARSGHPMPLRLASALLDLDHYTNPPGQLAKAIAENRSHDR